ncbi:MAG: hypothetical protein KAR07_10220 [Spirochaetes bacterium]|nr:hypothetical protein [Spirochaetota bacterium]
MKKLFIITLFVFSAIFAICAAVINFSPYNNFLNKICEETVFKNLSIGVYQLTNFEKELSSPDGRQREKTLSSIKGFKNAFDEVCDILRINIPSLKDIAIEKITNRREQTIFLMDGQYLDILNLIFVYGSNDKYYLQTKENDFMRWVSDYRIRKLQRWGIFFLMLSILCGCIRSILGLFSKREKTQSIFKLAVLIACAFLVFTCLIFLVNKYTSSILSNNINNLMIGLFVALFVGTGLIYWQFFESIAGYRLKKIEDATIKIIDKKMSKKKYVGMLRNRYRYSLGVIIDILTNTYGSKNLPKQKEKYPFLIDKDENRDGWALFDRYIRPVMDDINAYAFIGWFACLPRMKKLKKLIKLCEQLENVTAELDYIQLLEKSESITILKLEPTGGVLEIIEHKDKSISDQIKTLKDVYKNLEQSWRKWLKVMGK